MMKSILWDHKNKSIRGSFVNLILTFSILFLIIAAAFDDAVKNRVVELTSLILGFFASSLGIWSYKKIAEGKQAGVDEQISQDGAGL